MGDPDRLPQVSEIQVPLGDALAGMRIVALPTDARWVGALMLIKTEAGWSIRRTDGLSDEELLGMMSVHAEMLRDRIRSRSRDEGDRRG